ncbi:WD40 repeat domain-containing protein [Anatilimnocola sp. NA78]|uniref:WD40 repeat domain-containing protein n=1 Tax=Anatilimnocola sp. NA78 TaxID=3415683 RepID=UPI003CE5ABDC
MSTTEPAVKPKTVQPFRFSLLTLLGLMTVAAVASAVLFARQWHADERLLMAFWTAGLLIGTSFGRARGTHGIYSGALGAVVGCLIVPLVFNSSHFPHSGTTRYESGLLAPYLTFVVISGWILAMLAASAYHLIVQGTVERWCLRMITTRGLIFCGVLIAGGFTSWRALTTPAWHPQSSVTLSPGRAPGLPIDANVSLAADGEPFAAYAPLAHILGEPIGPRIFRLSSHGWSGHELKVPLIVNALTVSPDGQQAAILGTTVMGNYGQSISLIDLQSSEVIREVKLTIPSFADVSQVCFSPDGKRLLLTSTSPRIQRLHIIDLQTFAETVELFPFAGRLYCSANGKLVVKIIAVGDETDEATAEIVARDSELVLHRLKDVRVSLIPIFGSDENRVALGERVWERPTGTTTTLPDTIVGFTANNHVVVISKSMRQVWPSVFPHWLKEMPFVRHLYLHFDFGRLQLIDKNTGQTIMASGPERRLQRAVISSDGRIVVSCTSEGVMRIWHVPNGR